MERYPTADLDDSSKYSNRSIFFSINIPLRVVVGKGSVSTAFVHGSVGPNFPVNAKYLTNKARGQLEALRLPYGKANG